MVLALKKISHLNVIAVFLCVASISFAFEKGESKELINSDLFAFSKLTKDLNQVSQYKQLSFRIRELGQAVPKVSEPQFPLSKNKKGSAESPLPPLSTDSTKINPVDIQALGFEGATATPSSSPGLLPIPQARVVSPVGEQSSKGITEAPLKTLEAINNPDVITELTPKTTRFGKDRYDQNLFPSQFQIQPAAQKDEGQGALNLKMSSDKSENSGNLSDSSIDEKEQAKKKEQEARENFQKTMKEFAERTEEREAFRLVDYYDLKNTLSKHESVLTSLGDDEIDERFVRNAKTIFERFGERDNSTDKKTFEQFLKRMQPKDVIFRSQELERSGLPSEKGTENHRRLRLE